MSFKLVPPYKKNATPIVNMPMEENVMGRADKRGNILLNKNLTDPIQIQDTIDHENVHIDQMKSGELDYDCLLYTSPSPRDRQKSRMPSSA